MPSKHFETKNGADKNVLKENLKEHHPEHPWWELKATQGDKYLGEGSPKVSEGGDLFSILLNLATTVAVLTQRVGALEGALYSTQHFIDANLRPDVGRASGAPEEN